LKAAEAHHAASPRTVSHGGLGLMAFLAGADRDLAELCIGRR
jgi:hypothetical protein